MPVKELEANTIKINTYAEDKIGLPNYSSVTIGGSITRTIPDTDDDSVLQSELARNFEIVEEALKAERAKILGEIQT